MAGRRRALTIVLLLAALPLGAGAVAGFVYAHEPQPDRVTVRVDTARPPQAEQFIRGTIASASPDSNDVTTIVGVEPVPLPAGTAIEELVPVAGDKIAPGLRINLGGNQGRRGFVLTGVVAMGAESAP